MKKLLLFILFLLPSLMLSAQNRKLEEKYQAGAVPLVNGFVQFDQTYEAPGKSKALLMDSLRHYIQTELIEGPDQLPQARITEVTPDSGIIAASIEEYMYFKRTNWQIHRVHFYYQLVLRVEDGKYEATMRNLHYRYDPEVTAGDFNDDRRAENWITDEQALTKDQKKLQRVSGKFRTHTIDRKDEIFRGLARAPKSKVRKKVMKVVEEEVEE